MSTNKDDAPLTSLPCLWQRITQRWSEFYKKNFVTWRLNWYEPRAIRRVVSRLEAQYAPSIWLHEFFIFFLIGVAASAGGILCRWMEAKPIMNDWALLLLIPPVTGIVIPLILHGSIWLCPRGIVLTNADIRRQEGQIYRMWKWSNIERAEIARALFAGEEMRVLQVYLRQPPDGVNPMPFGIAAKITEEELQQIFAEYQVPLTLTDQPPAGMERWQ